MGSNKNTGEKTALMVATFMRSGTHLTMDFVRKHFPGYQFRKSFGSSASNCYVATDVFMPDWAMTNGNAYNQELLKLRKGVYLLKAHFTAPDLSNLSEEARAELTKIRIKKIYVLRDPRAVISSMREFTADIPGRQRVEEDTMDTFVEETISRWVGHVNKWCVADGVCVIRFEDIIKNPGSVLSRLEEFIGNEAETRGSNLLPEKYGSKWQRRLLSRVERNPRSTEIATSRRPPPWREILKEKHLEIIRTHAGTVLEDFDYTI